GRVVTPQGIQVVDTTGAGDIFGGSVLSRILRSGKAPEALTEEELRRATRFACCAASLSTQQYGGIPSVAPEEAVLALMEAQAD
ncbi:MAG: PfkB family carbohydrate kinase, partial [Clostridiales bacterium]|nr:PfkB family carbohydrate kinase [Clostridiales bacterium]